MNSGSKKLKIVMAGVLPPPIHGQSLITQTLFEADLPSIEKYIVEIRSSKEIDQVGRLSVSKILGLPVIISKIIAARFSSGSKVFYYTAGSAAIVPLVRDFLILVSARPFFKKVLIHYHSGGLPDYLNSSPFLHFLGRWIYGQGSWALSLSRFTPVPGIAFGAEREIEVPNGINISENFSLSERRLSDSTDLRIVFIGNLFEDKGIFDLLAAAKNAAENSRIRFTLTLAGKWSDRPTMERFHREMKELPEGLTVDVPAPRYGEDKWNLLAESDLFVFPTYYRNENLPLVVIEAMAASLPVVATRWRGLPSLVEEGRTGFLVEPRDLTALTQAILHLAESKDLRISMGDAGRTEYERRFTTSAHLKNMRRVFLEAIEASS